MKTFITAVLVIVGMIVFFLLAGLGIGDADVLAAGGCIVAIFGFFIVVIVYIHEDDSRT